MHIACLRCMAAIVLGLAAGSAYASEAASAPYVELDVPMGQLRAYVAPQDGGGLEGLQVHRGQAWLELLYRGMEPRPKKGPLGKASILWPAVGRNYGKADGAAPSQQLGWTLHGKTYPITIHGFARDLPWKVVDRGVRGSTAFVVLTLRDNAQTRRSYPFGFVMTTRYEISGDTLIMRQIVRADPANNEPMPFSIGNHVTFRLPLVPGTDPGRTTIQTPATKRILLDKSLRPSGQISAVDFAQPRALSSFKANAPMSLSGYPKGKEWVRLADPSGFTVTVSHSEDRWPRGVPVLFNLWGDVQQGYFAPEPWVGKQNSLSSKDGVIWLSPGDSFRWTVKIQVSSPR